MDANDESAGSYFCRDEEKVKAMELLEESWFFENLFKTRRPMFPRCNSDPCSSSGIVVSEPVFLKGKDPDEATKTSSTSEEEEEEEECQKGSSFSRNRLIHQSSDPLALEAAIKAHSREMKEVNKKREGNGRRSILLRTPSLPPFVGREEKFQVCDHRTGKQTSKSHSLVVSEPVFLKGKDSDETANKTSSSTSEVTKEEEEAEEENCQKGSDFSRNRLMHQSSDPLVLEAAMKAHSREIKEVNKKSESNGSRSKLLRTPSLPPFVGREEKFQTSKSYSIPRSRPVRNTEGENSFSTEGIKEMRRRFLKQKTMRKSLSDLEFEEVQGFKDLGFSFEKETISPSVASIIPGLQEKNREETEENRAMRRPYLSEAWLVQSCVLPPPPPPPPPIPNYTATKSSKDMKQHIKFWARAVASNVRQEC